MDFLEFSQNNIINSFNNLARKKERVQDIPTAQLNNNGVCLALSMAFAHAHLRRSCDEEYPQLFEDFLAMMSREESLEKFFNDYASITQQYLSARKNGDQEAENIAYKKLKPLWTQMAIIDLMLLIYAQPFKSHALLGVDSRVRAQSLAIAGLKKEGSVSYQLPSNAIRDFLLQRSSLFSSVISPFKRGGTYIIALPSHACAAHIEMDGTLKLYDPNFRRYISTEADIKEYEKLFVKYYKGGTNRVIPVEVFSVSFLNPDLQQETLTQEAAKKIQKRLNKASDHYLAKNYNPKAIERMLQKGLIRSLFYTQTPLARKLLTKTIERAIKQGSLNFWQLVDNPQGIAQTLLSEMFYAVHQTRDFDLLEIVFSYPELQPWSVPNGDMIKMSASLSDPELLTYVLHFAPKSSKVSYTIFDILEKNLSSGHTAIPQMIISGLLSGKLQLSDNISQRNPMEYLRLNASSDLFSFSVRCWLQHNISLSQSQSYHIDNYGLLSWLINNGYSEENLAQLLTSDYYTLHESDYWAVLMSNNTLLKKDLLKKYPQWRWEQGFPHTPLETCLLTHDNAFLKQLLQEGVPAQLSTQGLTPFLKALNQGDFELLDILLNPKAPVLKLPEPVTTQERQQVRLILFLQKIWAKKPLSRHDSELLGSFLCEVSDKDQHTFNKILTWAAQYQWPIEQALLPEGTLLLEQWLAQGKWVKVQSFWSAIIDLKHLDRSVVCQATVDACARGAPQDWVWQQQWVQRTGLCWDDFLPDQHSLIKELYCHSQAGRGLGFVNELMAQPSQNYVPTLFNNFSEKLFELESVDSHESLLQIIADLDLIKDLIAWSGLQQGASTHQYATLQAATEEISSFISMIETKNMGVRQSIQALLMQPSLIEIKERSRIELAEVCQQKRSVWALPFLTGLRDL